MSWLNIQEFDLDTDWTRSEIVYQMIADASHMWRLKIL